MSNLNINFNRIALLLRGCSGAGKSTLSEFLVDKYKTYDYYVCSADDYFIKDGKYNFDANKLGLAHNYCYKKFEEGLQNSVQLIILNNTNTRESEINPYILLCKQYNYTYFSIVLENRAETTNIHGVNLETLKKQENRLKNSIKLI